MDKLNESQRSFTNILRSDYEASSANSSGVGETKEVLSEVQKTMKRVGGEEQMKKRALKHFESTKKVYQNQKKRISEDVRALRSINEGISTGNLTVTIGSQTRTYQNKAEQEKHRAIVICRLKKKRADLVTFANAKEQAEFDKKAIVARLDEQIETIETLQGELASLIAVVEANKEDDQRKSRAIFQEAFPDMLARVKILNHTANTQQDQLDVLRDELDAVMERVAVLEGQVAEQVAVNTDLIGSIEENARKIAGNTVTQKAAVEEVATLSSENTTLRSENTTLKAQLTEAQRTIAGNTVTLHQAEAAVEEVQAPLRAEVTTLKAHLSGVKAQLSEVKAQFAEAQRTIEKLEKCKPKTALAVHDLNCE